MKKERKFLRQCSTCRQYKDKKELIRITKDYKTKEFELNVYNSIQGRSIYLCKNEECVKKFIKNKKKYNFLTSELCEEMKKMCDTAI